MQTLRLLVLAALALVTFTAVGQDLSPGRQGAVVPGTVLLSPDYYLSGEQTDFSGTPGYAEAITPDIQALANGLQDDPVKIFNYVHNHIKFVLYFGSMKGAELTLLEQSGNDFDQCALLSALLQAAGYSPSYQFAMIQYPYQATDGSQNDLQHWFRMTQPDTNWTSVQSNLVNFLGNGGYPFSYPVSSNVIAFQHEWVTLAIGGTNYLLDPSFKVNVPVTGINLGAAMGFSSNALMSAAGGVDTSNYTTNLDEINLRATLTGYTTNLLNYIASNYPNASVEQILGGWQIVQTNITSLSQAMILTNQINPGGEVPLLTWNNEPTNFMSTLSVTIGSTNLTWYFPQLEGQEVSLTYDAGSTTRLWLANSVVLQTKDPGATNVTITAAHPWGGWNFSGNLPVDDGNFDKTKSAYYQNANSSYALMYGFDPSVKWLNEEEQQLDIYRSDGYTNGSVQMVNATLNVMGMQWMVQTALAQDILCQEAGQLPMCAHRIGRMAQESGHGYYVDVYMQQDQVYPATGDTAADIQNQGIIFDASSYFWSAFEHAIIQQMQDSNLLAASTVKILQIANTNHQAVYLATSSNWSTIEPKLVNYGSLTTTTFPEIIDAGGYLLLPQNGAIAVAGSGSYTGYGYVEVLQQGSSREDGTFIGGGYSGGYVSNPSATVNPVFTQYCSVNSPSYFNITPVSTPAPFTADPVDTANGTYQVENTDLSLGQAEPRGITLTRYYNGTRRFNSVGGMTGGWVHNYCVTANNVPAPQAGLGETTPAQMASMLVASCAALSIYNNTQPDPKNWMVTILIAKWAVDQLITNGVSVNLGKDTLQFVQQPNGVFTPPANSTATLIQTNSAYQLGMRHGNTFKFNTSGYLTNIVDQYGNGLNVTYNASNWVNVVKDWKGRTLTFNYSGAPSRLTSVSDGTRTIDYGYSTNYNGQGDLTSFTDAQGDTSTFTYDTNHEVTSSLDALNRLVVSNFYDGDGHVNVQYTEGLTNKMWQIFWSGFQTISEDPAGGQTTYFYDDTGRLTGTQDALGNLSQIFYDGQNHIVETVSPLNETNLNFYDGNNNLIEMVDPLGFTNQFVYDGDNNLIKTIDALGNISASGYNAEFSPVGQTNGAGDFVNYAYNSNGTLTSRTDSGGTTTYGYDSFGQLNSVVYPNGLGTNTFANSFLGDVTNHIDGRGFSTVFQYDARRQLTNTIGPTNLITKTAYDAVGNAASTTDARGNVTSQAWSATRHLLATTLPAMPQGTPVATNIYDNREWLIGTLDPLQNSTTFANDPDDRLVAQTDPLSRTTSFGYDADGRKLTTADPANETNSQTWDAKGELIDLIDGAGHVSARGYDGAGNQTSLVNRNTNTWHFYFDAANRLTNTVSPRGRSTVVALNHQGLPALVTDPLGNVTTNLYDAKGRLTNRADSVASTFYNYDPDDNMTSVVENGNTNSWTYDAYDHVASYTDVNGNLIQYRYDANGNLTNLVYPGGRNVYYAYDNDNHLTNVVDWSGRKTSITYDLDGRLTAITRPNGTSRTISYDSAGEITNILEQMANGLPISLMCFNWNSNSTMQSEFVAPLPHTNAPPARTMAYDADNELSKVDNNSVSVDNDGNLTSGPLTNDTFATYTYDARNRLLNVGGVTNIFDAMNNRIGQTYGTNSIEYVINPNAKLPQVLERIKNGVTTYYIYGPGLLYQITEAPTGTNTVTYHYDYRGSTIALTGDDGLVTDRMEYSLYATMTYHVGTSDTPFLFNGQFGVMSDPNGLLYMRARYYSPFLCRFLNPDPSGFSGGMDFYVYAGGDPVSVTDPAGLDATSIGSSTWITSSYGSLSNMGLANGATPQNLTDPFSISNFGSTVNTPPSLMGTGMSYSPPSFTSPGGSSVPYFDPNQQTTWSVSSTAPNSGLDAVGAVMLAGLTLDTAFVDPAALGAAEDSLVTVTHFTDPATAQLIEQSGAINAQSFVTLPSQIPAGASASEIESILEIRAGAGQMSYTFQVPQSSLLLPENGATTSGGALQFRLANPVPVGPGSFVPTVGGQ